MTAPWSTIKDRGLTVGDWVPPRFLYPPASLQNDVQFLLAKAILAGREGRGGDACARWERLQEEASALAAWHAARRAK